MAHFDFNLAGAYAYEQALLVIRRLGLPMDAVEQQFRRMVFNVSPAIRTTTSRTSPF
jgi:serine/threonine-protein kinase HipA